jgi:hypothetical protein
MAGEGEGFGALINANQTRVSQALNPNRFQGFFRIKSVNSTTDFAVDRQEIGRDSTRESKR